MEEGASNAFLLRVKPTRRSVCEGFLRVEMKDGNRVLMVPEEAPIEWDDWLRIRLKLEDEVSIERTAASLGMTTAEYSAKHKYLNIA